MSTSVEQEASAGDSWEAPRFLPLETVSVRLIGGHPPLEGPIFGILSNISETGACIITNFAIPPESKVSLELESSRWPDKFTVDAVAVWGSERMEPVKEIVGFLTGLRFAKNACESVRHLLASGIFQPIP